MKIIIFLFTLLFVGCGNEELNDASSSSSDVIVNSDFDRELAIDKYEEHVHPLLVEHCSECHKADIAPKFAIDDAKTSFGLLIDHKKLNLEFPAHSRIVRRLSIDDHNCWGDCEENGDEIKRAIEKMVADLSLSKGYVQTKPIKYSYEKNQLGSNPNSADTFLFEAEDGELSGPLKKEFLSSFDTRFISFDDSYFDDLSYNKNTLMGFDYSFYIVDPGEYNVYLKYEDTSDENVFRSVLAGGNWSFKSSNSGLQWVRSPYQYDLLQGENKIALRHREHHSGFKIDKVLVSKKNISNFDFLQKSPLSKVVLEFDLDNLIGFKAKFSIDIYEHDDKNYRISNPKISSSESLFVQGVEVVVNGISKAENINYLEEGYVFKKNSMNTISQNPMIIPIDRSLSLDDFSIRFQKIEKHQ